jgi:hypothetical protein
MSEGFDATFSDDKSEVPAEKPESGQPRDESGRFASQAPAEPVAAAAPVAAPEATPAPVPAAPVEALKAEPGHVPISALLDEREKRQRFERELSELRAQQRQPEPPPSFQTPEEIAAYVQREASNAAWSAKVEFSEGQAREKHTDAVVDAALQWGLQRCEQEKAQLGFSPFAVEQMRQRHPIDWLVRQQKRDTMLTAIGDDPEAYIAAEIAKRTAPAASVNEPAPPAPAAAPPQPVAPKPTPRASLVSAPTAGGMQSIPVVAPFEATFQK